MWSNSPVDSVNMHTSQLKGYCGKYLEGVLFKPTCWLFKWVKDSGTRNRDTQINRLCFVPTSEESERSIEGHHKVKRWEGF